MILVVTSEDDLTVGLVIEQLGARGVGVFRFNTETFPATAEIAITADNHGISGRLSNGSGRSINLGDVTAAYFRKPHHPRIVDSVQGELQRKFAKRESQALISNLTRLVRAPWLNHPDKIAYAEHKLVQLDRAAELGFNVPRSIVTNDPIEARDFIEACAGTAIAKTLRSPLVSLDPPLLIFTNELSTTDLDRLDQLALAPCIIQDKLDKRVEIRATVVGSQVFAAELLSQEVPGAEVDWRRVAQEGVPYRVHDLSRRVCQQCIEFVQRFGLQFGAIDLILDHSGNYTFLECNPNGEWGWIEEITALPIASAIADVLVSVGNVGA